MADREWVVPGYGQLVETGTREVIVPGYGEIQFDQEEEAQPAPGSIYLEVRLS